MANCIDNVLKMFPEADRDALSKVFEGMKQDAKDGFLDAAGNSDEAFMAKAQKRIEAYKRGVQIAEAKAMADMVKRSKNDVFIKQDAFESKAEGIQASLTGTNKNVENARGSVFHRLTAKMNELVTGFVEGLEKSRIPGLLDVLKAGADDRDILKEWWEVSNGREGGVTKNAAALEIAKGLNDLQKRQLLMKNDAGAMVGNLEGRTGARVYDPALLLKAGATLKEARANFIADMLKWVDSDKSFKKDFYTENAEEVLGTIFDRVTRGEGGLLNLDDEASKAVLKRLDAPANLARAMERSRTIHMSSADAEYEFMKKYGAGNLAEQVYRSSRQVARQSAMIERFGTSPKEELARQMRGLSDAEKDMVMRHWANVDGSAQIPGQSTLAQAGQAARMAADMSKLGTAQLSHLNNVGSRAALVQMEGGGFLEGMQQSLEQTFANLSGKERDEALYMTGVGADARIGLFFDRSGTTEGGKWGWFNKAHQTYFKLTGIRLMSEIHEAANAQMLAARIGYHADTPFSGLNEAHANVLQKYGIGPAEWEVIRNSVKTAEDGRAYGGIDTVNAMDKDNIKAIMEKAGMDTSGRDTVGQFQREVSTKLANYFNDRSAIATGKPGAFERASFLNRGKNDDTVEGALARFFGQFKGYAYTMASQFSKAYYYEALEGKSFADGAATTAPLMVSMMALGYMSWASKNMLQGKSPPMPTDASQVGKILTDSMIRGGVGGIYADYLLGEFDSRHGRSALAAIAGPVVGQVNDVADMLTEARRAATEGNASQGWAAASALGRFVSNNTPFVGNTPIIRQGLDYLFLNHLAETLNPGYLERQKARLEANGVSNTYAGHDFLQ